MQPGGWCPSQRSAAGYGLVWARPQPAAAPEQQQSGMGCQGEPQAAVQVLGGDAPVQEERHVVLRQQLHHGRLVAATHGHGKKHKHTLRHLGVLAAVVGRLQSCVTREWFAAAHDLAAKMWRRAGMMCCRDGDF